jgi:hypothetical protein
MGGFHGKNPTRSLSEDVYCTRYDDEPATVFGSLRQPQGSNASRGLDG